MVDAPAWAPPETDFQPAPAAAPSGGDTPLHILVQHGSDYTPPPAPAWSPPETDFQPTAPPTAGPAETPINPTDEMSSEDRLDAGVGKVLSKTGSGVKSIAMEIGNHLGLVTDEDLAKHKQMLANEAETDKPLDATTGGKVGEIAGTVAQLAAAPESIVGQAAGSAALSGVQPVADGESRGMNTILGGAMGALGTVPGRIIAHIAQPLGKMLTPAADAAVQTLKKAGVPLDLWQQSGARFARTLKGLVDDSPFFGHSSMPAEQATAFNRAVLSKVGEDAGAATPTVLAGADARIGGVMDGVAARNPINFDHKLMLDLADTRAAAASELTDAQLKPITNQIGNIFDKAQQNGGQIDGKAYQNARTILGRLSMGSDQSVGHYARLLRGVLDDALERSASPQDVAALRQARTQYGFLQKVQPAVSKDNEGNISPALLVGQLGTKANAKSFKQGAGDQSLNEIAKAGNQILGAKQPNSGTTARLLAHTVPAAAIGLYEESKDDPGRALLYAGGAFSAPLLARLAMESPTVANYLAQGIQTPWIRHLMMTAGSALSRVGAAAKLTSAQNTPNVLTQGTQPQP